MKMHRLLVLGPLVLAGCSGTNGPGASSTGGAAPTATSGGSTQMASGGNAGTVATSGGTGAASGGAGAASGGAGGVASAGGTGNSAGAASGGVGGGTGPSSNCTFTTNGVPSETIPTVGVIQWSSTLPNIDSAHIDFGLDTNYGMTAPVDLKEPMYKTLLLGMKSQKMYHYRIVAGSGAEQCTSQDYTIQTGSLPTGLARVTINTPSPQGLYGGFMVSEFFSATGRAFILDADGEYVWWYSAANLTRVRFTPDGKYALMAKGNVPETQGAQMTKVALDGTGAQDLTAEFPKLNHDFDFAADGSIFYIAYGTNGCDDIMEHKPDGTSRVVVNSKDAEGGTSTMCHVNALHYSKDDDTVVFSDLDADNIIKVKRDGTVVWILGGEHSTLMGDKWDNQHGFHLLGPDHLLVFNNGANGVGSGTGSLALELKLDLTANTFQQIWKYQPDPVIYNQIMGDVQRLENGNTFITYSTQGVVHEVDASGKLLQSFTWGLGSALGYATKRKTLYGPDPK